MNPRRRCIARHRRAGTGFVPWLISLTEAKIERYAREGNVEAAKLLGRHTRAIPFYWDSGPPVINGAAEWKKRREDAVRSLFTKSPWKVLHPGFDERGVPDRKLPVVPASSLPAPWKRR
jgi:hypothetical protein